MKKRPFMAAALLLVLWICLCRFCGWIDETPDLTETTQNLIACEGIVCGIEYGKESQYFYLNHLKISTVEKIPAKYKIKIIADVDASFAYGNRIYVKGKLLSADTPTNEGQFDSSSWQRSQRILGTITHAVMTLQDGRCSILRQRLHLLRRAGMERLLTLMPQEAAGVLGAMLFGDRSYLDEEIKSWYQQGGISHILAISGLHISLIGMALYHFLRKLGIPFLPCSIAAGFLMILYACMTGAGTSTCRAVIMFLVFLGAQCLGRTYDLACSLSLAVILLLLYQPLFLFQAGFQLSVLAVLGICTLQPALAKLYGKKIPSGLSIQLVLLPCILWHYYEFPAYGILLNFFILPLLPMVLTLGILTLILSFFSFPAAVFCGAGVQGIVDFFCILCKISANLPFSRLLTGRPPVWSILIWYVLLFGGILFLEKTKSRHTKTFYPVLLILAGCMLRYPDVQGLSLSFLDVGQGDCIFIRNETGISILCDGGSSSVSNVGQYRILPFLKYRGIKKLDYVFLTHMDADHINGVRELLEMNVGGIAVGTLVLPQIPNPDDTYREMETFAKEKGIALHYMTAGEQMQAGKLTLTCLHPSADFYTNNKNEASLVLHVKYQTFDAMLMGDLEKNGESLFLQNIRSYPLFQNDSRIELLKAGHHGSGGATSEELLRFLNPELTILSYGENNRYGHPAEETMKRLKKYHCLSKSTAKCGEISIFLDKNEKITARYENDVLK